MRLIRRRTLTIALALAAVTSCRPDHEGLGPDVRRGLTHGREAAAEWIVAGRTVPEVDASTAIAVGYLERLRLGLGSPFRLIDQATRDPRLDDSVRVRLGWALIAHTLDRGAYQVPEPVLDRMIPAAPGQQRPALGHDHLELIENAIRESRDPRSGELAVRLAYALAAAELSLTPRAPELGARVAALIRDRELARADVFRLLRAAGESGTDPLALVSRWRAERRFGVEQPPMRMLSPELERESMELAPRLAAALRELRTRGGEQSAVRQVGRGSQTLLGPYAATRLAAVADSFDMPAQTPIVISARMHRKDLIEHRGLSDEERQLRARFSAEAVNEERFAALHAQLRSTGPSDVAAALSALNAAVSMRAYAQEEVWFPGYGGPSVRELQERYGLAAVRFGDDVPAEWRPYYRRLLHMALADLYRVLPALDLDGLTVVFSEDGKQEATLAMHDPRGRRLMLPPSTAAGTIAHEVAHDLDWQVALRRYRVRGDYATDRATRSGRDRLAHRLSDLAGASLNQEGLDERTSAHARRPAEVFARNIDWFVAVSLASDGRINGYLSSVQDDVLTGYGTVRPPDITGTAGRALVNILDEVAPVYPETRDWFLRTYGPGRALTPYDLVRRVLETSTSAQPVAETELHPLELGTSSAAMVAFEPVERAREDGFAAIDEWICRSPGAPYDPELERSRRRIVAEAANARGRGIAIARARELAGEPGRAWVVRQLYGPRWPAPQVDSAVQSLLEPIARGAHESARADVGAARNRFDLSTPPARCAAAPFRVQ